MIKVVLSHHIIRVILRQSIQRCINLNWLHTKLCSFLINQFQYQWSLLFKNQRLGVTDTFNIRLFILEINIIRNQRIDISDINWLIDDRDIMLISDLDDVNSLLCQLNANVNIQTVGNICWVVFTDEITGKCLWGLFDDDLVHRLCMSVTNNA